MRKKLRDTGGLTMIETLCAVLILVLLLLLVNTGLQMAMRTYRDITGESETQLLLSSLSDALIDKLRYAVVNVDESGNYQSCSIGNVTVDADGKVTVDNKALLPDGAYGADKRYRAGPVAAGTNIIVTPTVNGENVTFTIKFKVTDTLGSASAETPEDGVVVRCLNPPKKEGTTP